VNPLMDAAACQAYADFILTQNANPKKQIQLDMVQNPTFELNDNAVIIDRDTFTYGDIYNLMEIEESYNDPSIKYKLTFKDKGFDLGANIYDRNGPERGFLDFNYDIGIMYDLQLPFDSTDNTDYDYTKQVGFN